MNLLHRCDVILWPKQKSGIGPESALYCIYTKPFSLVLVLIFNKPKKKIETLTYPPPHHLGKVCVKNDKDHAIYLYSPGTEDG